MTAPPYDRAQGMAPLRLAIVGGGQLGMFLSQAARSLGIESLIITPGEDSPATAVADEILFAAFDEPGLAERIAARANVVTFELEDVPLRLLDDLATLEATGHIAVHPAAATLSLLKNKARQKQWLAEQGLPTLPFRVVENPVSAASELANEFGLPFVQKAQTGGYDGYGVQVIRDESQLGALWATPSVIEPFLRMSHELAVVVARSVTGEIKTYPTVRMTFDTERNILDMVVTPAGLGADIDQRARELACEVVEKLEGVGVFAIEMFLDPDGQIVINEISPRVHNSGHVTLETAAVSQFEQHVRAVCGLPLRDPDELSRPGVMRNLLYSDALELWLSHTNGPTCIDRGDARVYWYGKQSARMGRKMGHVTLISDDPERAGEQLDQVIDSISKEFQGAAA